MMAAYIIAVQGTVRQAMLLGLSAAFSHSIIVWVLAMLALFWGNALIGEELEPWFMIVSGVLVLSIAAWMFWRQAGSARGHHHHHDHHHDHGHSHTHSHHHHDHADDTDHHHHTPKTIEGLDNTHMDAHAQPMPTKSGSGWPQAGQELGRRSCSGCPAG